MTAIGVSFVWLLITIFMAILALRLLHVIHLGHQASRDWISALERARSALEQARVIKHDIEDSGAHSENCAACNVESAIDHIDSSLGQTDWIWSKK